MVPSDSHEREKIQRLFKQMVPRTVIICVEDILYLGNENQRIAQATNKASVQHVL